MERVSEDSELGANKEPREETVPALGSRKERMISHPLQGIGKQSKIEAINLRVISGHSDLLHKIIPEVNSLQFN